MFYTDFANDYEEIFPFRENIFSFLNNLLPTENSNILDIGCGTGHYCGKFAERGHKVTGIDLDREMIANAEKKYSDSSFAVLNLTDIKKLDQKFDLIYSTGNVISHVDKNDLTAFISNLKENLKPGSIWIFQVVNWDYIMKQIEFSFPVIETDTKVFRRKYTDIKDGELLFHTELINKLDNTSLFKDNVKMYPLSSKNFIEIHENKGFKLQGHYADYSGKSFSDNSFSANIFVFSL